MLFSAVSFLFMTSAPWSQNKNKFLLNNPNENGMRFELKVERGEARYDVISNGCKLMPRSINSVTVVKSL